MMFLSVAMVQPLLRQQNYREKQKKYGRCDPFQGSKVADK